MTLSDIIDLDEILTVNSMWENKFFEPWVKVGAALVWRYEEIKKSFKKPKSTKIIEYDDS